MVIHTCCSEVTPPVRLDPGSQNLPPIKSKNRPSVAVARESRVCSVNSRLIHRFHSLALVVRDSFIRNRSVANMRRPENRTQALHDLHDSIIAIRTQEIRFFDASFAGLEFVAWMGSDFVVDGMANFWTPAKHTGTASAKLRLFCASWNPSLPLRSQKLAAKSTTSCTHLL